MPTLLGKHWESKPALEAACPFPADEALALQHVAGHVWGLRGLMATCRSPSKCPSCPWMSRGTHLHCSWEEMLIQDNTDG